MIFLQRVEICKALRDISPHQSVSKKSEINFLSQIVLINFISEYQKQIIKPYLIFTFIVMRKTVRCGEKFLDGEQETEAGAA